MREEPTANEGTCDSDEEVAETIPNPAPCTIWPASHPAMRPTTNMISRLSPDMCIFESSSCISKLTNFRPRRRREIHHQRRAWPK